MALNCLVEHPTQCTAVNGSGMDASPRSAECIGPSPPEWVRSISDSQRNRSMLQRLSFACPRNVSHEGPLESGSGRQWAARTRWTTSLSISISKARLIDCAIRGQPQIGLRRFISTMAPTNFFRRTFGSRTAPLRRKQQSVLSFSQNSMEIQNGRGSEHDGCTDQPRRTHEQGRDTNKDPVRALRFGDRCRERLRISSWCLIKRDSATTERRPPGPSRKQNKFLSPLADQFRGVLQDQVPAFQDGANLKSRQIVSDTLFQGFFIQLSNTLEK